MAWRIKRKFNSLKEALDYYKQEYLGVDTDICGQELFFTESAFPHLIDLSYNNKTNATMLLGKIYKGELTLKNAKYNHYRLCHLPCIKLLYRHPDEIWKDFKNDNYIHYLKYITTAKSQRFLAKTFLAKKTKPGHYVPITCYPVAENYLKKIKSTAKLWTK